MGAFRGGLYLPRRWLRRPDSVSGVDWNNRIAVGLIHAFLPQGDASGVNACYMTPAINASGYRTFSTYPFRNDGVPCWNGQASNPGMESIGPQITTGDASVFGLFGVVAPSNGVSPIGMSSYGGSWPKLTVGCENSSGSNYNFYWASKCGDGFLWTQSMQTISAGKLVATGCSWKRASQIAFCEGQVFSSSYDPGTNDWYPGTGTKSLAVGYALAGLAFAWSRFVRADEYAALYENPWQLFAPMRRKAYFFDMASSPLVLR